MSNELRQNRIDQVPAAFVGQVKQLLPEIYNYALNNLNLEVVDGKVVRNRANMRLILTFIDDMGAWMLNPETSPYLPKVEEFMREFAEQRAINNGILSAFGTVPEASQVVYVAARRQTLDLLLGEAYKTNFIDQIKNTLIESVSSNRSFADMTKAISDVVIGDGKRDGKLLNWAKQVAHDRFAMTDAAYVMSAADEMGIQWFRYTGGLIDDSRPFCVERNGKIYHRSQIEDWADLPEWSGRMPNTDRETIFVKRGGWRCNHVLTIVTESSVPQELRDQFA